MSTAPVNVGVVGLGRSGYGIHLKALARSPERYRITAVADTDTERCRKTAGEFAGAAAYPDLAALLADPAIALVVVATPNYLHAPYAIQALRAGKHVVCEKPFGRTVADVDEMIAAAESTGSVLAPFHNLRFDESFNTVRDVIASGALGQILQIRIAFHSFARRWDWQTLQKFGGGQLYNNAPHALDLAFALQEACGGPTDSADDWELWPDLRCVLASGDADDHVRLTLCSRTEPNAPLLDVEVTASCAFPQDRYHIVGSRGGLHGGTERVKWKWLDPATLPPAPPVSEISTPDRSYNRETLPWREEVRECKDSAGLSHDRFYAALYETLTTGAPFPIIPENIRKRIAILERAWRAAYAAA